MATEMLNDMRVRTMCASTLFLAFSVLGGPGGLGGLDSAAAAGAGGPRPEDPFQPRPLPLEIQGRWLGDGVAYGPHRDGQFPGGQAPSREEIREDLLIMARRWSLLRTYGAGEVAETILAVIRDEGLGLKVVLGVWIAPEEAAAGGGPAPAGLPGDDRAGVATGGPREPAAAVAPAGANRRELEAGIRLAAAYPEIVVALCVGNETQVSWSGHRVPPELLLACLREARARVRQPVSTADDYGWWRDPVSRAVAAEVDFITAHAHPLWNGIQLEGALAWTREVVAALRAMHPDRPLVLGETGWATSAASVGEQARLIKGRPGEPEQAAFFREVTAWAAAERLPLFWFEAFDEKWKGGDLPDEVEKHWGLYRSDRTPKEAMSDGS